MHRQTMSAMEIEPTPFGLEAAPAAFPGGRRHRAFVDPPTLAIAIDSGGREIAHPGKPAEPGKGGPITFEHGIAPLGRRHRREEVRGLRKPGAELGHELLAVEPHRIDAERAHSIELIGGAHRAGDAPILAPEAAGERKRGVAQAEAEQLTHAGRTMARSGPVHKATIWLAASGLLLLSQTAVAQRQDPAREYETCMALARQHPDDALERAGAWIDSGGGPAARHCQAVALIGLGRFGQAAERLEAIAGDTRLQGTPLAKAALAQAVQAWLLAGDNPHAVAAANAALKLTPDDPDLLIDRAIGHASAAELWEAVDDLNRAIELQPKRAEAYVYRGSAYRLLEAFDLAREDLAKALSLDPANPEALLESGILKRLANDKAGARADWLRVLDLAPSSPSAEAARANIEKMDVAGEDVPSKNIPQRPLRKR